MLTLHLHCGLWARGSVSSTAPCAPQHKASVCNSPGAEWTQRGGAVWGGVGLGVQRVQGWAFQGQYQYSADSEQNGTLSGDSEGYKGKPVWLETEVGVGRATGQCVRKEPSAEVTLELPIKSSKICLYYPQMLDHYVWPLFPGCFVD